MFVPLKDEEGKEVVNEEGVAIGQYITPKIKDLGDALYLMVTAGLELEAELEGKEIRKVSRRELLEKADMMPVTLGLKLHEEMMRGFRRKNGETTQEKMGAETKKNP